MTEPGPLVSAEWLASYLGDPAVRIVHVSVDRTTFDERHLPGAVFSDLHVELAHSGAVRETGEVERTYLTPGRAAVEAALARWGVGQGDRVVFYDDVGQNRYAIRGYWLLRLYGFDRGRIHVLDGGLPIWEREANPVTSVEVRPPEPATPVTLSDADRSVLATAEDVKRWSDEAASGRTRVLDVRSADEYLGRDVRARRGGRVPGACHRLWTDFLAPDGTIRPAADCLALVRGSGVEPGELRAVYCQGGVRAALVWFVLSELGGCHDVRNYAESWEEWGNRLDLPVEV